MHVGYPLVRDLGTALVNWAARHPQAEHFYWIDPEELKRLFPALSDFEQIISDLEDPPAGSTLSELPKHRMGSILAGIREVLCEHFDEVANNDAYLYRMFAEKVCVGDEVLITFNYDVSLEAELRKAGKWEVGDGYGFRLGDSGTPPSPVRVLKLHGSTSWIDILFGGSRGGDFGAVGPDGPLGARPLIMPKYFRFFGYEAHIGDPKFRGGGSSRHGSLILPARSKKFDSRDPFWRHLWGQAEAALAKSSEIVVIGYSLAPADERARRLLLQCGNKNASVTISCGRDNTRIEKELVDAGFSRVKADLLYFEDWLRSGIGDQESVQGGQVTSGTDAPAAS